MDDEFFEKLKKKAESFFEVGGSHDFSHTERVYNLALKISENEDLDLDVVKASALLHDIARKKEDDKRCNCHAEEGSQMAKELLRELEFPEKKTDRVVYAVRVHRHSGGITPETKEAKILQDADRLDALGAITIARMFSSGGKAGIPLHDPHKRNNIKDYKGQKSTFEGFNRKILKITPEKFHTKKAREIAKERYSYVEEFLDRFLKEWEGKI